MAGKYDGRFDQLIKQSAIDAGIDPTDFHKQIMKESSGNPSARSPVGALGLGQVMPKWWTGKFGLNTEADFLDPKKNVPAAAQIMAQHVKTYGGWNEALVAYNAGQGKNNANIAAYRRGDLAALPQETQDYLKALGKDVQGNYTKAAPGVLGLSGKQAAPAPAPVAPLQGAREWVPPVQGKWDSFKSGVAASTLGTMFRRDDTLKTIMGGGAELDDEDKERISSSGIGPAGATFVIRNATGKADIEELITLAKENQASASANRTMMGDLSYGLGEMTGDPITYGAIVAPVGVFAKPAQLFSGSVATASSTAFRMAGEGALLSIGTETIREGYTGVEADYASAMAAGAAGGLAFGAVLGGIGKGFSKARGSMERSVHRAEAQQTVEVLQKAGYKDASNPTIFNPMDIDAETGIKWRKELYPETTPPDGKPGYLQPIDGPGGYKPAKMPEFITRKNGDTIDTRTGIQYSNSNPFNPMNNKPLDVYGKRLPTFFEIGDVLAKSSDAEFRGLFHDLGRNTRGYVDGSSGKFGATAQDVAKAMDGQFVSYQSTLQDARRAAMADPAWASSDLTRTEITRAINKRVDDAIRSKDHSKLTKGEAEMAKLREQFYKDLGEQQAAPGARWGVQVAPLLDEARLRADYGAPIVYNEVRIAEAIDKLGIDGEAKLQDLVAKSFLSKYQTDKAVKAEVDKLVQASGRTPWDIAMDTAYGIVRNADNADGSTTAAMSRFLDGGAGAPTGEAGFRKARNPFGHDGVVNMPDGGEFRVSDLFSHDTDLIDSAYFHRVRGDMAVTVGTGADLPTFNAKVAEMIGRAGKGSNLQAEGNALDQMIKNLYGMGQRSEHARLAAFESITKNLAFMKSSAYMGILNYTEIATGIRQHGLLWATTTIPGIGKALNSLRYGKNTAKSLHLAQNIVWGMDLDRAIRPTYSEAIDRNVTRLVSEAGDRPGVRRLGAAQGAIAAATDNWWTSRMLRGTTQRIIESSRAEFFADLAGAAHGRKGTSFVNPKKALEASVSKEQLEGIKNLLREATKMGEKGDLEIVKPDMLLRDPRAADLRRYGQYWSERVIQQNTASNSSRLAGMPVVGMFTQFMSFVQRSLNAKLMRGANNVQHGNLGEAVDMLLLAPLLAGVGYAGIAHMQSLKYPDAADREKFLAERLGEDEDWGPLVANSFKRTSAGSSLGWVYDTLGASQLAQQGAPEFFQYAGMGKTSTDAKLAREKMAGKTGLAGFLADSVTGAPAVKMMSDLAGVASAPLTPLVTPEEDFDQDRFTKGWQMNMRGLVPNDPLSQRVFMEFIADPY